MEQQHQGEEGAGLRARAQASEHARGRHAADAGPPLLTGGVPQGRAGASACQAVEEKPVGAGGADRLGLAFDWYQATVREADQVRLPLWAESLGHRAEECSGLARMYRYKRGLRVLSAGSQAVCSVLWDAPHGCGTVIASGEAARAFVGHFRARFPEHEVTRADVCRDFYSGLPFEEGQRRLREIGEIVGVAMPYQDGDVRSDRAGRTQYLGARGGVGLVRLYEKGKQVAAAWGRKGAELALQFVTEDGELFRVCDWVRLECEVRPETKEARRLLASAPPASYWGVTPALRACYREFFGGEVEVSTIQRKTGQNPHEKKLRHMVRQYANSLAWLERQCCHLEGAEREQAFGLAVLELLRGYEAEQMSGYIRI
jgi:hypothetical protein